MILLFATLTLTMPDTLLFKPVPMPVSTYQFKPDSQSLKTMDSLYKVVEKKVKREKSNLGTMVKVAVIGTGVVAVSIVWIAVCQTIQTFGRVK